MSSDVTTPDLATARRLLRPGVALPVVRELDCIDLDPLVAFASLAADAPNAALLETSEAASADADMSIIAPNATALLQGEDVLDQLRTVCADEVADIGIELPRFIGGAIGMLSHEHVRTIEPTVPLAADPHPIATPNAAFLLTDTILVFEHRAARVLAIHVIHATDAPFDLDAAYATAVARLDEVQQRLDAVDEHPSDAAHMPLTAAVDASEVFHGVTSSCAPGQFEQMVRQAHEHVLDGECVQIVVSQRFDVAASADPLLVYRSVRATSPAPYHVLLRLGDVHVIGASPEQLVGVANEHIVTHPIAGTRPRGGDEARDQALERELLADPKERSEHMMLVDLGRNDVGRAAEPGTVRVERLCEIERFSHVMHLVSRVGGTLRSDLHPVDALRAAFPAGTLTGAPKVRAMQIIAQLEPQRRGAYGGVVGYVGHGRVLDAAITIRTAVVANGMASVQAGAGVVADSVPASEEAETRHKAHAMLAALARAERTVVRSAQAVAS